MVNIFCICDAPKKYIFEIENIFLSNQNTFQNIFQGEENTFPTLQQNAYQSILYLKCIQCNNDNNTKSNMFYAHLQKTVGFKQNRVKGLSRIRLFIHLLTVFHITQYLTIMQRSLTLKLSVSDTVNKIQQLLCTLQLLTIFTIQYLKEHTLLFLEIGSFSISVRVKNAAR